jgi:hypothetical protein
MLGLPNDFNVRVQTYLATLFATQITSWAGVYIAWASSDVLFSLIVNAIVSIPASIAASILIIIIVRARKLVDYVGKLAEDEQNSLGVKGVVMQSNTEAASFPDSPKIVGPNSADAL